MQLVCPGCQARLPLDPKAFGASIACHACKMVIALPADALVRGVEIGGDFVIERALGNGGMGMVYLAHQMSLDRPAALKMLHETYSGDAEFISQFVREARAAAKLNHPNIVQAYAVGEDAGRYYFAMEYIDGESVKQVIRRDGMLPPRRAAEIVRDVASALAYAWNTRKIVHQDIKPDNIMLTGAGEAKLADLGLARVVDGAPDSSADTEEVLGTPQYISPEQLTGVPTDVRSDLYSLGASFYHMVTGRFPYQGKNTLEISKQHLEGTFPPPHQVNPAIPELLSKIIVRMMCRNIHERFQKPEDVMGELNKFLENKAMTSGVKINLRGKEDEEKPKLVSAVAPVIVPPSGDGPKVKIGLGVKKKEEPASPAAPPVAAPPAESAPKAKVSLGVKKAEAPAPPPPAENAPPAKAGLSLKKEESAAPEGAEKSAEAPVVFHPDPPSKSRRKGGGKKIILWGVLGVFGIALLAVGGAVFVVASGRIPVRRQAMGEKLAGIINKVSPWKVSPEVSRNVSAEPQDKSPSEEPKVAETVKTEPKEEPKEEKKAEVVPVKKEKLPPVTRPDFLKNIQTLMDAIREKPDERAKLVAEIDAFFLRTGGAQTAEERSAVTPLLLVYARMDEQLHTLPARAGARNVYETNREKILAEEKARQDAAALAAEQRRIAEAETAAAAKQIAAEAEARQKAEQAALQTKLAERSAELAARRIPHYVEYLSLLRARSAEAAKRMDAWSGEIRREQSAGLAPEVRKLNDEELKHIAFLKTEYAKMLALDAKLVRPEASPLIKSVELRGVGFMFNLNSVRGNTAQVTDVFKHEEKTLDLVAHPGVALWMMNRLKEPLKEPQLPFYFSLMNANFETDLALMAGNDTWKAFLPEFQRACIRKMYDDAPEAERANLRARFRRNPQFDAALK